MSANRMKLKTDETNVIAGLEKHASAFTGLLVQGKAVSVVQAVATLQARIDAITAAQTARALLAAAVKEQQQELAGTSGFVLSLVTVIRGMYAGSPSNLADFGLTPKKALPLTVEQKALANQKRAATRLARHTMGTKQRAAIKAPVVVAPTPAIPAAPSGGAAGGGTGTPHA